MGIPKQPKIITNYKNLSSKRTHSQDLQKDSVWGQTSEIDDSYTLSFVLSEAQRSQKGGKMGAKMEPQGTQNHKKQQPRAIKKTAQNKTATSMLLLRF